MRRLLADMFLTMFTLYTPLVVGQGSEGLVASAESLGESTSSPGDINLI